jgi:hypothetical protein
MSAPFLLTPNTSLADQLAMLRARVPFPNYSLRRLDEQAVCFCKYGPMPKDRKERFCFVHRVIREASEATLMPYLKWSLADLETAAKRRGLSITDALTREHLVNLLLAVDARFTFPFMKLPPEIRQKIYLYALCGDGTRDLIMRSVTSMELMSGKRREISPPNRRSDFVNVGLLRATPFIEREAAPILYANNRLRLHTLTYGDSSAPRLHWDDYAMLQSIGPDNIRDLRHLSFRHTCPLSSPGRLFDVHISLASDKVESWLLPLGNNQTSCPCERQTKWSLMLWRERLLMYPRNALRTKMLKSVNDCIETVRDALERFHALCHHDTLTIQPTLPGLLILAEAASFLLLHRSRWLDLWNYSHSAPLRRSPIPYHRYDE